MLTLFMHVQVAIVGAGFSGLGMAIRLAGAGRGDFVILEAGDQVGGTWRDNRYPGAACDIPSRLYSLSFALSNAWTKRYPEQPEIQAYLEELVDRFDLRGRLRSSTAVAEARWLGDRWRLLLPDGEVLTATHVVFGIGALRIPRYPAIPGRSTFQGVQQHSARWKPVDLRGKRVGVVGTGASAVQLVPQIASEVASLTVFQRTPAWVRPRHDRPYGALERQLTRIPGVARALRWRRYWVQERRYPLYFGPAYPLTKVLEPFVAREIRQQVGDPELAARLTPDYRLGCKRVLVANGWYETLALPHVDVVDAPVTAVVPDGVVAEEHHALDVLIWCTGFQVDNPLGSLAVFGVDGVDLRDRWGTRPRALRGIQVPDFPNSYWLLGPNTALGHNSVVVMIEAQLRYVLHALELADANGPIDARPEALDAWIARVDRRHGSRVWASGCDSWYLGAERANFTIFPGSSARYVLETARVRAHEVRYLDGTNGESSR